MYADEKIQFIATVSYSEDVPDRNVTESVKWHSSNTTIAEVSPTGMVTATKESGTVEITADYDQFNDTKSIVVYALTLNTKRDITFDEKLEWVLTKPDDSNASLEQNGTLYTGDKNTTLDINVTRYDINASLKINVI
ncbi:MAG: hypothetical protein B5M52_07615 [Helicobacteraceae bacterium 4484_230]|nr:MAG: hypothetical protein B5M52_07615 [Helicobacteraceae bacterium 4484_230]